MTIFQLLLVIMAPLIGFFLYIYLWMDDFRVTLKILQLTFFYHRRQRRAQTIDWVQTALRKELIQLSSMPDDEVMAVYQVNLAQVQQLKRVAGFFHQDVLSPILLRMLSRHDWLDSLNQPIYLLCQVNAVPIYRQLLALNAQSSPLEKRQTIQKFIYLTGPNRLTQKILQQSFEQLTKGGQNPQEEQQFLALLQNNFAITSGYLVNLLMDWAAILLIED